MRGRALHTAILRGAALLVPASARGEWLAQWNAELWYVERDATAFCLGSLRDALWLRYESFSLRRAFSLESPLRCVLFLAGLSALTLFFVPPPRSLWLHAWSAADAKRFLAALFWMCIESVLVLIKVASLEFHACAATGHTPSLLIRLRKWFFLGVKLALLPSTKFLVTCALVAIFPPAPLLLLVGLIFGFRWILADQRRRCPVCLNFLCSPSESRSHTHVLLEPRRTELICAHGHGSLYVPSTVTTWAVLEWEFSNTA